MKNKNFTGGESMGKDYYLGLDMGTSSIGWAVTDSSYHLLRKKGKDLWGVRLYSEANTSAERRTHRTARRRRQREKVRIGHLNKMFLSEINKIDPGFYQRLKDSKYYQEDKMEKQPFALFADTGYTDKEYFEDYPTIFHLRKHLIESKNAQDIRLVYLAILNMFKHRGHFLNTNLDGNGMENISDLIAELKEQCQECMNVGIDFMKMEDAIKEILPSRRYSSSVKADKIMELAEVIKSKNKPVYEIVKMMCGLQGKIATVFVNGEFDEENKKFAISFKDGNFEEKIVELENIVSDEEYEIILLLKRIHDWGILASIMKGNSNKYLSYARVELYDKHKKDLEILKKVIKEYAVDEYDKLFRVMDSNNYSSYVGSVNSGKEKCRRGAKASRDEFFKRIKKILEMVPDECEDKEYILGEIETENFLPKQLTSANGVIPYQLHLAELKAILDNAKKYLEFLNEKDESGLSVSDKIIQLFSFQIPYYIGPLFNGGKGNAWVVRKELGVVFPWNINEKVDEKQSAENFISKMVNHCTYLNGEIVLPKNSLLYEKFRVLNELNNLKINGEKISVVLKQEIYTELFKKGKKVKGKHIEEYLKKTGRIDSNEMVDIAGIDGDFANTLSNYSKFAAVYGVDTLTYDQEKMSENIIKWITVYGESKKFIREKIEEAYGAVLSAEQIKRIMGFKFKDWGRLSKEFLCLEGADKDTGEVKTIISRMWDENYNLMELLSYNFSYVEELKNKTRDIEKSLTDIEYEDLEELYISAPVRRMVWQTILILKEIYSVMGCEPKKIFVEMARDTDAPKERKESRKKKFQELYKNCKEEGRAWAKEISETEDSKFSSKKLYLYYTQKGRCMYTGQPIELQDLFNDNLYDIDHIYPRHFIKDDSIENNLVLVRKEDNAHKSDNYPLEDDIRRNRMGWWKSLLDGGFITKQKYERLVRTTEFTDDEKASFISRQIVETRQGTKVITDLFEKSFEETEVIYVKAGNVSDFRKKFDLLKCREVNDFHHANDAYLNIVVGNTYNIKFTKSPINFIKEYRKDPKNNKYHMSKIFDYKVARNGEVAWSLDGEKSIDIVRKMMKKNTPLITKMNYEVHGGLADQTIYSAKEAQKAKGVGYIPVKANDERVLDAKEYVCKYGGYKKYTGAYFFLVEHVQKGKRVRTVETMPLYLKDSLSTDEALIKYCEDALGYKEVSVRLRRIKMYSLIKVDGYYLYLTGRSENRLVIHNAVAMIMHYDMVAYIKKISKYVGRNLKDEELIEQDIDKDKNLEVYDVLIKKYSNSIYKFKPNNIVEKLVAKRDKFIGTDIKGQIYVILQILNLSMLANITADLELLDEAKKCGEMKINKKITERREFKLINQSITGLYENEIDLLTV